MSQKQVLGKGLASLFPAFPMAAPQESAPEEKRIEVADPHAAEGLGRDRYLGISVVSTDEITENKFQPRSDFEDQTLRELADSIRLNGIIQPLVVRKTSTGKYELIAGERRLRASKMVGLKQVPIVIRKSSDRESLELALIENIQRENLNCVEEARAYFQLQHEFSLKQEEIALRVGKDRATIANYLRLLDLPEEIIKDLKEGRLTFGHGRTILGIDGYERRLHVRAIVLEKSLSVRATETLVQELNSQVDPKGADSGASTATRQESPIALRLNNAGQDLTRKWSIKVQIKGNDKRGKIIFQYNSREDLDRLLESLQN